MCRGFYDNEYYDIRKGESSDAWRYGMFTANGETGIIESMSPDNDVIIYNNTKCVQDTVDPMETAEIAEHMDEIKERVLRRDEPERWAEYVKEYWRKRYGMEDYISCGSRPYFPAAQLRIETDPGHKSYERYVDFDTGEIGCVFTDSHDCPVTRKSFVSRDSSYAVTFIKSGREKNHRIEFDAFEDMGIDGRITPRIKFPELRFVAECGGAVRMGVIGKTPAAHIDNNENAPETGLSHSGYAVALRVLTDGAAVKEGNGITVTGSKNVMIIARADYRKTGFDCIENVRIGLYDKLQEELSGYIERNHISPCESSYEAMLRPHAEIHWRLFGSASLNLCHDGETAPAASATELHRMQRRGEGCAGEYGINSRWLELLYENSRYAMVCSHGYSTARLGGIWIGNWLASWSGDHTVNANTNAQVSGINTGNLPELAESYINFILDYAPDWQENAERIHGIKDAIKAPARTDGAGCGAFYSTPAGYPMIFWNSGAAWQLVPVFEYWECYGARPVKVRYDLDIDQLKGLLELTDERVLEIKRGGYFDIEKDILRPLITKLMNFWYGFADGRFYTDKDGNMHINDGTVIGDGGHYIFAPAYSPENAPSDADYNKPGCIAANTAMDIAAARDSVRMYRRLAERGVITDIDEAKLRLFEERIPPYMYNGRGAIKEWALSMFGDHDNHRHSSHLYAAWPGFDAAHDKTVSDGIRRAIMARRIYAANERTTGFGRMQLAIAAARIGDRELFGHCLFDLVGADFEYPSLMTSHDMGLNKSAFCTDNALSIHGVINEALVYSDSRSIRLLPCSIWESGTVRGIMTRCGVRINEMRWTADTVEAELEAVRDTGKIGICCGDKTWRADLVKDEILYLH